MSDKTSLLLRRAHDAARELLHRGYPGEVSFFEQFWTIFESGSQEWLREPADARSIEDSVGKMRSQLGLTDSEAMDLITPRFLAMLFATIFELASQSPGGGSLQVGNSLEKYGKRFRVPMDIVRRVEPMIRVLLSCDSDQLESVSVGELVDRVAIVRWDWKSVEGSKDAVAPQLKEAVNNKLSFHIYLNDLQNEFLVNGGQRDLTMDPKRLLVLLFKRIGAYWQYADLCRYIWGDPLESSGKLYNLLNRVHKATDELLRPYVILPRGQERCYVQEGIKENVRYCLIFLAGDY